jgi:hypothetical protein
MLDATTIVDPALNRDDEALGHELDHRQSLRGDLASSLTPLEERGRRRDRDDRHLHDVIRGKDARGHMLVFLSHIIIYKRIGTNCSLPLGVFQGIESTGKQ